MLLKELCCQGLAGKTIGKGIFPFADTHKLGVEHLWIDIYRLKDLASDPSGWQLICKEAMSLGICGDDDDVS